jgi:hypothetical protein
MVVHTCLHLKHCSSEGRFIKYEIDNEIFLLYRKALFALTNTYSYYM